MKPIGKRASNLFLFLVFLQAMHSIEEYTGKLWDNFPPATFLCGLISDDLETGFLIANIGIFVIGIACWFFIVHKRSPLSQRVIWIWIIIELINGVGHPIWSLMQQSYTPGVITAPILLITAILLIKATNSKLPS